MDIEYAVEPELTAEEFQAILVSSTLAERRPTDDLERLVGISLAITDFSFCCYLSDLAVDAGYQRKGIGKRLIAETHRAAGEGTTLILVAAPAAEGYYPKIGMKHLASCWAIPRKQ